ncbi:MAG: hypothetical protein QM330_00035 [Acidobacteriota bacterium]|nr:hypothetical protein [Acidobacteriota bacterium]
MAATVVVYDRSGEGELVPLMTSSSPEIVEVIQRLISRELYRAAYITERPPAKRRASSSKKGAID